MRDHIEINGVKYEVGTAGSLVLACPKCGEEHFRDPDHYIWSEEDRAYNEKIKALGWVSGFKSEFDRCFTCRTPMEPIRIDEIETRWKPFWKSLGHDVEGIDY